MQNLLMQTIETLAKEKGIEPETIITAIEEWLTASRSIAKTKEILKTRFNQETAGRPVRHQAHRRDVTNDATDLLGRRRRSTATRRSRHGDRVPKGPTCSAASPAQTAKQVIFQKVREAERENIFAEYNERVGEVVNSTVKRFGGSDRRDRPRGRCCRARAVARRVTRRASDPRRDQGVNRGAKGPQIVMRAHRSGAAHRCSSRRSPRSHGTGDDSGRRPRGRDRARVRPLRERDVDPVGACVGMKGTRVQAIIRELRGEKIDIVDGPRTRLCSSPTLSPATAARVDRRRQGPVMEVVVEISSCRSRSARRGQTSALAAKLTGWRIDIKSEEEKRREVEAQFGALELGAEGQEPAAAGEPAAADAPGEPESPAAEPSGTDSAEDNA
jgi:N utilization substance protein A